MQALFESGRIVDVILLVFAVEAIVAFAWLRPSGRAAFGLAANLAAGACLLLGVRAALVGSGWHWVAFWIALSLPFHLADLASRWRMRSRPSSPAEKASGPA
jgi:hypothetical protein